MTIPARVSIVTLGVHDLEAMRAFYLGLGWNERAHYPTFSMFETGGALLALFPFDMLAEDGRVAADEPQTRYRGFALALNVERREMVDEVIDELRTKGARITKEPEDAEWGGRSAYFVDPEDNLWEVAWNPNGTFDERGAFIPEKLIAAVPVSDHSERARNPASCIRTICASALGLTVLWCKRTY